MTTVVFQMKYTGEIIIGEEVGMDSSPNNGKNSIITNPLVMHIFSDPQTNQTKIHFAKWFVFAQLDREKGVKFSHDDMICYAPVEDELAEAYKQALNPQPQILPEPRIVTPDDMLNPDNLRLGV